MFPTTFQDMGIPAGYAFKHLLFSPTANVLVLHACSAEDNWRPERLYFRQTVWNKYRLVGNPGDLVSQESPFVHPTEPLLAFNSLRHEFLLDTDGQEQHHGDWHSLQLLSLESGSVIRSITPDTLRLPVGVTRGWICEIVAFGAAGLFVKAGLSKNESSIVYCIAELDVEQNLKPLFELPAVFM
jgi:hypothetical protein